MSIKDLISQYSNETPESAGQAQASSFATDMMGLIVVKSFGAKGDGTTNDTVAIRAAATFATAHGMKSLYFPTGTYKVDAGFGTELSGFFLWGDNSTVTGDTITINQVGTNVTEYITDFTGLTDAPKSYTDNAGKVVAVNTGEDALEFKDLGDTYYTESEVDEKVTDLAGAGRTTQTIKGAYDALDTHKSSDDHDGRYYTEAEVDASIGTVSSSVSIVQNNLDTHKTSDDHDGRYYSEDELDAGQLDNRYYTEDEIDTTVSGLEGAGRTTETIKGNADALEAHKTTDSPAHAGDTISIADGGRTKVTATNLDDFAVEVDETFGDYVSQDDLTAGINELAGATRTTETVKGNADALTTHKSSTDHDNRYYTETEVDTKMNSLAGAGRMAETIKSNADAIASHIISATAHNGDNLDFTPGTSGMTATKVSPAIKEIKTRVEQIITTPISGAAATQEVVDARQSAVKATTYASLDARLESIEGEIVTPSYSVTAEATAAVITLPSTASKGQLSVSILGSTRQNNFNYNATYAKAGSIVETKITNGFNIKGSSGSFDRISWANIVVKPSTQYTLSRNIKIITAGTAANNGRIRLSGNGITDVIMLRADGAKTFTSPSDGLVSIYFYATDGTAENTEFEITNVLLEEGSAVGSYIGFGVKSTLPTRLTIKEGEVVRGQAYTPANWTGRSLPNGIKDELNFGTGQENKNVGSKVLQASDVVSVDSSTALPNVLAKIEYASFPDVIIPNPADMVATNISSDKTQPLNGGDRTAAASVGKHYKGVSGFYIIFANGTTLEQARVALAGATFNYQLSSPIVTHIDGLGALEAYPNGTIIVEPMVKFEQTPSTGALTKPDNAPNIVAVESIKEITLAPDGTKVYTDYTKAYNTTAGAVYLINGWNVDATYEVVYSYDASTTTLPTVKYSYPTNLKAQVESNANEIQQNAKDIDDLNDFTISQLISLNSATAKNRVIMIPLGNISATASQIAFIANTAGKITNVYMSTGVAITASDTDYWQIDLINKGTDGSKTDVFCTMTTKTTGGSGFTAYTAKFVGELTSKANLVQWGVVKLTLTKTGNPTAFSEAVLMLEWLPTF